MCHCRGIPVLVPVFGQEKSPFRLPTPGCPDAWMPGGQRSPLMSLERPDVSSRLCCCGWKETLAQEERPVRKGTLRKTPAQPGFWRIATGAFRGEK